GGQQLRVHALRQAERGVRAGREPLHVDQPPGDQGERRHEGDQQGDEAPGRPVASDAAATRSSHRAARRRASGDRDRLGPGRRPEAGRAATTATTGGARTGVPARGHGVRSARLVAAHPSMDAAGVVTGVDGEGDAVACPSATPVTYRTDGGGTMPSDWARLSTRFGDASSATWSRRRTLACWAAPMRRCSALSRCSLVVRWTCTRTSPNTGTSART